MRATRRAARLEVADQPCARARGPRRRPLRRTTGAALARHRADGGGAHGARLGGRHVGRRTGRSRPVRSTPRRTVDCGLAGTVMRFVPPVAALSSATVHFDGDPHARTRPMAEVLTGLRGFGVRVDDDGRGTLPFDVVGHRRGARRTGDDRRLGLQPVHLGAAAGRGPLRRGRRRAPRRQARAVAPPHRDDGRVPARARRRGRRQRAGPVARASGTSSRRGHRDRAGPLQRRAVPDAGAGQRRLGDRARLARRAPPSPATRCPVCSRAWARRSRGTTPA